mgnify:FL=1
MKLTNINFLAKANAKVNKNEKGIKIISALLVISLTLISSFSIVVTKAVDEYKEDFRARTLEVAPVLSELDENVIESIKNTEHVVDIFPLEGIRQDLFDIKGTSSTEFQNRLEKDEDSYLDIWSLLGDEKRSVIAGKTLEDSPAFSCIVPSDFYPFEVDDENENPDYIKGESLIGETITVKASSDYLFEVYNYRFGDGGENTSLELPAIEYKLKVVGTYYLSPTEYGNYDSVFISGETAKKILDDALAKGGYKKDDSTEVGKWWSDLSLRTHYVLVDDYENIESVYNALTDMNVCCANDPELGIQSSIINASNIFRFASVFLIIATFLLSVITIIQSTTNALSLRKSDIGLLKAIGYKNSQIFACLYCEQLRVTFTGFTVGTIISVVITVVSNLFFSNRNYIDRLYIINWGTFGILLAIAFLIVTIVPLICQLIALHKLNKIQPKDAMNE